MLQELRIQRLGVIDDAVLDLHPGLTVLTGETGAGKTMVVTGLGLLLGARADAGLVRTGASTAVVEGLVDVPESHPASVRAAEAGAEVGGRTGPGPVGLGRRTLSAPTSAVGQHRSVCWPRSVEHLVAVHGQADQWRLRHGDQHRAMLDRFGGDAVAEALAALHRRLRRARGRARRARLAARRPLASRAREVELLQHRPRAARAARPAARGGRRPARRGRAARPRRGTADGRGPRPRPPRGDPGLLGAGGPGAAETVAAARQRPGGGGRPRPRAQGARPAPRRPRLPRGRPRGRPQLPTSPMSTWTPRGWPGCQQRRADLTAPHPQVRRDRRRRPGLGARARLGGSTCCSGRTAVSRSSSPGSPSSTRQRTTAAQALTAARRKAASRLAKAVTAELAHLAMGQARVEVDVSARSSATRAPRRRRRRDPARRQPRRHGPDGRQGCLRW